MSENKTIRIECSGTDSKPLDKLIDFQDGIKKLPKKNLEKLAESILKYGFSAPFFIWKHEGTLYKLDGHQRGIALKYLRDERGFIIPDLPVVYIEADTETHAREKLLHITSQYGEFDRQGLDAFILDHDLDISSLDTLRITDTEIMLNDQFEDEGFDEEFTLNDGDREPFQQLSFTLADQQAEQLREKLEEIKKSDLYSYIETFGNTNSNGNALYALLVAAKDYEA